MVGFYKTLKLFRIQFLSWVNYMRSLELICEGLHIIVRVRVCVC